MPRRRDPPGMPGLHAAIAGAWATYKREHAAWEATHPPRYLVVVRPVLGRTVRYYERHEYVKPPKIGPDGMALMAPVLHRKPTPDCYMRDRAWAEKMAAEIGGRVIDTQPDR